MENENDILSKIPLDMPAGPYLLGYVQAVYDLNKDWDAFRRDAAKDILCAIISTTVGANPKDVTMAIDIADELIRQLKNDEHESTR